MPLHASAHHCTLHARSLHTSARHCTPLHVTACSMHTFACLCMSLHAPCTPLHAPCTPLHAPCTPLHASACSCMLHARHRRCLPKALKTWIMARARLQGLVYSLIPVFYTMFSMVTFPLGFLIVTYFSSLSFHHSITPLFLFYRYIFIYHSMYQLPSVATTVLNWDFYLH